MRGRAIVVSSWLGDVVFAATGVPFAVGADGLESPAVGTALTLFGVSLVVWTWSFGVALVRSTQGDDVAVASLYLTVGGAPRRVRVHLFSALAVCLVVAAATAAANPFGVLVPMLPLGLVGLWAARHGTFPARPASRRG